jgi:hypothetical protein
MSSARERELSQEQIDSVEFERIFAGNTNSASLPKNRVSAGNMEPG